MLIKKSHSDLCVFENFVSNLCAAGERRSRSVWSRGDSLRSVRPACSPRAQAKGQPRSCSASRLWERGAGVKGRGLLVEGPGRSCLGARCIMRPCWPSSRKVREEARVQQLQTQRRQRQQQRDRAVSEELAKELAEQQRAEEQQLAAVLLT